jgi:hypothetical protein
MDLLLAPSPVGEGWEGGTQFTPYCLKPFFQEVPKLHNIFTNDVELSIAMIMPQII